jgi:hypothetical protein
MMFNLNLPQHRKTRVWLDELPDAAFGFENVLQKTLPGPDMNVAERKAAVEMLEPKGGMILYGLLGAGFKPNSSGILSIKVAVGQAGNSSYQSPLVLKFEKASIGLEKDFAQEVLRSAADETSKAGQLPSGDLVFNCAVQGAVGSNRNVFRQLAVMVAKLILLDNRQPSQEELVALLK